MNQYGSSDPFQDPGNNYNNNSYGGNSYGGNSYGGNPYGANPYAQQDHGDYRSNNVEMEPLNGNNGYSSNASGDLFSELKSIKDAINRIESDLEGLKMLQNRMISDSDSAVGQDQLEAKSTQVMSDYKAVVERVRQVKSRRESQQPMYAAQVRTADRQLKDAIRKFQQYDAEHRRRTQEQVARQYRIVQPNADESEIRAAVDSNNGAQVFQQAVMQSNRRGNAAAALNAVRDRHQQMQNIERQMQELAQLFQDLDTIVIQQDEQIRDIEVKGEEVVENLDKGNQEVGTAVNTARATRKKKWICLGICVAIVIIIAIIVAVYVTVTNGNSGGGGQKRSLEGLVARVVELGNGPAPAARHPIARRLPPAENNLGARWMVAMN